MPTCRSCGHEAEAKANFCANCGEPLWAAPDPAMEGMIRDARRTLSSNPDDAGAHYNLALAYLDKSLGTSLMSKSLEFAPLRKNGAAPAPAVARSALRMAAHSLSRMEITSRSMRSCSV